MRTLRSVLMFADQLRATPLSSLSSKILSNTSEPHWVKVVICDYLSCLVSMRLNLLWKINIVSVPSGYSGTSWSSTPDLFLWTWQILYQPFNVAGKVLFWKMSGLELVTGKSEMGLNVDRWAQIVGGTCEVNRDHGFRGTTAFLTSSKINGSWSLSESISSSYCLFYVNENLETVKFKTWLMLCRFYCWLY